MKRIAFVPLRSGSKGIKNKNIKEFNNKPLCYWTIKSASEAKLIDKVYVSTDSKKIIDLVESFNLPKVETFLRSGETSMDSSSTESAMLEIINNKNFDSDSIFILIQATSPFTLSKDLDNAISKLKKGNSIISVCDFKRFVWDKNGPINYNYMRRNRRQEQGGYYIENGAFYISYVGDILKTKSRISGQIEFQIMSEESSIEIDTQMDWDLAEYLFSKKNKSNNKKIKLVLSDLDGVLTDGGVYYSQKEELLKKFNMKDGMGFQLLRENNIKTGIITSEKTSFSDIRASKIKADFLFKGDSFIGKLNTVKKICDKLNINLSEVAYMGDDLNCYELLNEVGFPACPNDAVNKIKKIRNIYISNFNGGNACFRDFIDNKIL
jgi:YrbI family 3-deoxy-D-manno-octulosonate 8-phosphate phosphatase